MNAQLDSQKTWKHLVSFTPRPAPSLSSVSSPSPEPLCHWESPLPHTQQKACSKIPKCRRDGGAWKPQSMQTHRLFPFRAAAGSAPDVFTKSLSRLWLRLHCLQVLQLLRGHLSIPRVPRPVCGGEERTEGGWEPCGQ